MRGEAACGVYQKAAARRLFGNLAYRLPEIRVRLYIRPPHYTAENQRDEERRITASIERNRWSLLPDHIISRAGRILRRRTGDERAAVSRRPADPTKRKASDDQAGNRPQRFRPGTCRRPESHPPLSPIPIRERAACLCAEAAAAAAGQAPSNEDASHTACAGYRHDAPRTPLKPAVKTDQAPRHAVHRAIVVTARPRPANRHDPDNKTTYRRWRKRGSTRQSIPTPRQETEKIIAGMLRDVIFDGEFGSNPLADPQHHCEDSYRNKGQAYRVNASSL